jgi:hypothetical protein
MPGLPRSFTILSRKLAAMAVAASCAGCGLLFGGEQKVDTKSRDYQITRLDREGGWRVLQDIVPESGDRSDVAFENEKSGAIISLNSVCGPYAERNLDAGVRNLLIGLTGGGKAEIKPTQVDGIEAREATVNAKTEDKGSAAEVKVHAFVLHKGGCSFDLMHIARPSRFQETEDTFERFVRGFHAR